MADRITSIRKLPSKRQFYNFLNDEVQKAFEDMREIFPVKGSREYNRFYKGQKIVNTGQMRASFAQPGRIHVTANKDKTFKAGQIVFRANKDLARDPITGEAYWDKVADDANLGWKDRPNPYKGFVGAQVITLHNRITAYAKANKYEPYWLNKYSDEQLNQLQESRLEFSKWLLEQTFGKEV